MIRYYIQNVLYYKSTPVWAVETDMLTLFYHYMCVLPTVAQNNYYCMKGEYLLFYMIGINSIKNWIVNDKLR